MIYVGIRPDANFVGQNLVLFSGKVNCHGHCRVHFLLDAAWRRITGREKATETNNIRISDAFEHKFAQIGFAKGVFGQLCQKCGENLT